MKIRKKKKNKKPYSLMYIEPNVREEAAEFFNSNVSISESLDISSEDKAKFLEVLEKNKDNINSGNFKDAYLRINITNPQFTRLFTEVLLEANIDPLSNMKLIPPNFLFASKIDKFSIPEGIKVIGIDAFKNCINLENIKFSNSVTLLAFGCFENCSKLENIYLNKIEEIGEYCFCNCKNLKNVIITPSTRKIDNYAFAKCDNLKIITFTGSKEQWYKIEKSRLSDRRLIISCIDGEIS